MKVPQKREAISSFLGSTRHRDFHLILCTFADLLDAQSTMPVFTEHSSSSRNLRVLPSFAPPLPRLSPLFEPQNDIDEKYEVVIVGVCCTTPIYTDTRFSPTTL